ncbi:MAG: DUF4258 domain-containing protein [Candidatus Hydrogenedentes bacterium]|nr:DUF4258 domain-containing protein [Candidatus Hydrogenedentota bacterium]
MHENIAILRHAVAVGRVQWQSHALSRCLERGITRSEVLQAMLTGEVIEVYAEDRPYPSCLILSRATQPLHVVAAVDPQALQTHIITAYRPDAAHFHDDWKTRRKHQ